MQPLPLPLNAQTTFITMSHISVDQALFDDVIGGDDLNRSFSVGAKNHRLRHPVTKDLLT